MIVKICGITRLKDAMDAVEAGASAIGFVFVRSSPRYIVPSDVRSIVKELPAHVAAVGVVADHPREDLLRILSESTVTALQFHGNEKPEDLLKYPVPVYKAFRVGTTFDLEEIAKYTGNIFLLDTAVSGMSGGTGVSFDWTIAQRAGNLGRLVLAGGITEHNIVRAVHEVRPYALDISSSVESAPGIKDKEKIRRLFAAIPASERGTPTTSIF